MKHLLPANVLKTSIMAMVILFAGMVSRPATAYEGTHYIWTYYLALHSGFTERQAFQIGSATYAIDWSAHTNPMPVGDNDKVLGVGGLSDDRRFRRKWRLFHAFVPHKVLQQLRRSLHSSQIKDALEEEWRPQMNLLWADALELGNPGPFLHFRQDRYPHAGWGDLFGHGPAGHLPDYLSFDAKAAWNMTLDTLDDLKQFRREMCRNRRTEFCQRRPPPADLGRLRDVLDSLMAAERFPARIRDRKQLLGDLKDYALAQHRPMTQRQSGRLIDVIPLFGVENIYLRYGISMGVKRVLINDPGPDYMKAIRLIRTAVQDDKRAGRLRYLKTYDVLRVLKPDDLRAISAHAPQKYYEYRFNADGRHFGFPEAFKVEDVGAKVGRLRLNYRSTGEGTGSDEVIEVTLHIPIYIQGMAGGIEFMTKLPVVIESDPDGVDALTGRSDTQTKVRAYGNGQKFLKYKIRRKAGQLSSGVRWPIEVQVYGLKPMRRHANMRIAPVKPEARPDWDQNCQYDNTKNFRGARARWFFKTSAPATGSFLICSDRSDQWWIASRKSGLSDWMRLTGFKKGGAKNRVGCYTEAKIRTNKGIRKGMACGVDPIKKKPSEPRGKSSGKHACVDSKVRIDGEASVYDRGFGGSFQMKGKYICNRGGYWVITGSSIQGFSCSDKNFANCKGDAAQGGKITPLKDGAYKLSLTGKSKHRWVIKPKR